MDHPKVVNAAYFSPGSGTKIMTTCIDNRCSLEHTSQLPQPANHDEDYFLKEWACMLVLAQVPCSAMHCRCFSLLLGC